ncbi:MAG: alpha-L-fucosidase [Bryobacteraceae bacterium]
MRAAVLALLLAAAASPAGRTGWFREARFGMFIHWGPYSQASVEASWPIMTPERTAFGVISEPAYRDLAKTFNPVKYDPKSWVRLAKAAGQRYIVFTSKHHDGFCMFDSAYTRYKITNTPYKKDVAAMLAEACREERMPLGFYYSPPDMDHPGYRDTSKPSSANWRGEPWRPEWPLYLSYMEMQLRELLTRYGEVALIWFDGLGGKAYDPWRMHRTVRELQPTALINNRVGLPGDFGTPEQRVPGEPSDQLFEVCMTINGTWGYNRNDTRYKSAIQLVRILVDTVSKGGNFLLNVDPTPEGEIQPEFVERLTAMGKWLEVNGESIYGASAGPLQKLPWGRTTSKGDTVYVHIFDWQGPKLELGGLKPPASVTLLASGRKLPFRVRDGAIVIDLPETAPDACVTVLALRPR